MERQKTQNSQHNIEGEEQTWRTDVNKCQDLLLATVIKEVWHWQKNRLIDQWNRVQSPEVDPHKYNQLIFDKVVKAMQKRKDCLFDKR